MSSPQAFDHSGREKLVRFGLADEVQVKAVEVGWPGGKVQTLQNLAGDRGLGIRE
ncbi:MAG TPA: ASPIC/UnbV domain-containing protein [Bryobacteraceae bacterium]|nr:ASPIC/UnbV domain-containing protein [Bryobacteraceae bacterium]